MTPAKWEIWFVNMPFDEGIGEKMRPALVLDSQGLLVLVGKMTSHPPRNEFSYEYALIDWQKAGLRCQTTLRLSKRVRLDKSKFLYKVGVLQPVDQVNVVAILRQIIKDETQ